MKLHVYSPEFSGFGGGIGVFSREVGRSLAQSGHDLRLVGKFDRPGCWNGSPLWGAGDFPKSMRNAAFATGAFTMGMRFRPQRILSCHLNYGPVAQLVSQTLGIPFTLVAHGIDVHTSLSPRRKAALRAADRLIAVSSWTRSRLLAIGGIDESRISILPNTVDGERFSVGSRSETLKERYGIGDSEKVILTVARLDPSDRYLARLSAADAVGHKGCDNVISAMPEILRACGPVRYIVAGRGSDRARLEALAEKLGVASSITFAGFVPNKELADHYRLADAFVMPSTGEGFGIVFLEAMACGTPVLAGNVDGSADALDRGELGVLVDPFKIDAIARGVISLLNKEGPDFWFNREALHDRVIARFGHEKFREKLELTLYQ